MQKTLFHWKKLEESKVKQYIKIRMEGYFRNKKQKIINLNENKKNLSKLKSKYVVTLLHPESHALLLSQEFWEISCHGFRVLTTWIHPHSVKHATYVISGAKENTESDKNLQINDQFFFFILIYRLQVFLKTYSLTYTKHMLILSTPPDKVNELYYKWGLWASTSQHKCYEHVWGRLPKPWFLY